MKLVWRRDPPSLRDRVVYYKALQNFVLAAAFVGLCGCEEVRHIDYEPVPAPVNVVLSVGNNQETRTEYDSESGRFVWKTGDRMAVWAKAQDGTYVLDGQTFNLLATGMDRAEAYFTATLQRPMDEGTYSYSLAYPLPESVEGTVARFTVPSVQDGLASDGVDIIVSDPVSGPALSSLVEGAPLDPDNILSVKMRHLLHFLRFYIPEGRNALGEPVTRIEFTLPQAVAGTISVDVADASVSAVEGGTNAMSLDLAEPLGESDSAVAGIIPPAGTYSSEDQMIVTVYSENKWATLPPFPLSGRTFAAGHVTPVALKPAEANEYYLLTFKLASNNLGEDPMNAKVSLPEGEKWPGTDSNVLDLAGEHGGLIKVGDTFVLKFKDESQFRGLSSKALTVTYESESAIVSETASIGDLSSVTSSVCSLNCPYLFFEDFSGVETFSYNDEYSWSNPGDKSSHDFLNGWTGARVGAEAGTAIRIACRRETGLANYPARTDSPFLSGLKTGKTVSLDVKYDYSMNREGKANIHQTVYLGYTDKEGGFSSEDGTGTFPFKFDINETTGSYTNINHTAESTLTGVSAPLRLCWRTVPETNWGANNNTCWLYLDNIKVKIKK